jgi:hypothetical protein
MYLLDFATGVGVYIIHHQVYILRPEIIIHYAKKNTIEILMYYTCMFPVHILPTIGIGRFENMIFRLTIAMASQPTTLSRSCAHSLDSGGDCSSSPIISSSSGNDGTGGAGLIER